MKNKYALESTDSWVLNVRVEFSCQSLLSQGVSDAISYVKAHEEGQPFMELSPHTCGLHGGGKFACNLN